jgi:hypothetical protein
MMDMASLILAVSMSATSAIAVWFVAMKNTNERLGASLPLRILMIAAAMALVGLGDVPEVTAWSHY